MGQLELADQSLNSLCLFERVEVFALNVLDQRHRGRGFVGHVLDEHRHLVEPGQLGGANPAFAGDDFIALRADGADQHRLHDPLRLDALRELVQRALVHARARLVLAGLQLRQLERVRRVVRGSGYGIVAFLDARAEQRFETPAEAAMVTAVAYPSSLVEQEKRK